MSEFLWMTLLVILLTLLAIVLVAYLTTKRRNTSDRPAGDTYIAYDEPDFRDAADFYFETLPENEILQKNRYWLVNGRTAQIEYLVTPGWDVRLRTARTGSMDLPREYLTENYESTDAVTINGVDVTHHASPGRRVLMTWSRDGFDYALYSDRPEMTLMGGIVPDFVENARAASV